LRMGRIDLPGGSPVATLEKFEILTDGMARTVLNGQPTPLWSVTVNHTPIGEVQTNDLVGTVSDERRALLAQETRAAPATKEAVKTQFLLAGSLTLDTLLMDADAAAAEAARVLALHDAPQDVFEVPVPMARAAELITSGLWLGSELGLDLDPFDLKGGKSFIVIGILIQRRAKQIVFRLWGESTVDTVERIGGPTTIEGVFTAAGH